MYANSRPITSRQTGPHQDLERLLHRHLASPYQRPIGDASRAAFAQAMAERDASRPLILDAGCGVGWSTQRIAGLFPNHWVIGVDKSDDRLSRAPGHGDATEADDSGADGAALPSSDANKHWPANARLVRADLVDFWRLLAEAGIRLDRHYILYPNPWPKIGHLARRWHGHAVFPTVLALGGVLECRSNWSIYVEEFALAVGWATGHSVQAAPHAAPDPWTPFERKYRDSGQHLYRCQVDLDAVR